MAKYPGSKALDTQKKHSQKFGNAIDLRLSNNILLFFQIKIMLNNKSIALPKRFSVG